MSDPRAKVAANLTAIEDMHTRLEEQAIESANDPTMPGGAALISLAHVASPEAWEHRHESAQSRGIDASHIEDEDDTWEPPLQTLLFWSEQWRREHGYELDRRPTLLTEASFIRWALDWAWNNEPHFEDFARDIQTAHSRLENVLTEGTRTIRGVQCLTCEVDLIRKQHDRRHIRNCDGHDGVCIVPHDYCPHDRGGLRDEWVCPSCERSYAEKDYRNAVTHSYFLAAEWLPLESCSMRTGAKSGSIKGWGSKGEVRKRKNINTGRVEYHVADVQKKSEKGEGEIAS